MHKQPFVVEISFDHRLIIISVAPDCGPSLSIWRSWFEPVNQLTMTVPSFCAHLVCDDISFPRGSESVTFIQRARSYRPSPFVKDSLSTESILFRNSFNKTALVPSPRLLSLLHSTPHNPRSSATHVHPTIHNHPICTPESCR